MAQILTPLEILAKLVSFHTVSQVSNLDLIDWLDTYLTCHAIPTARHWNEDRTKAALLAHAGPWRTGGVVLSGHSDVVPVVGQTWSSDPFALIQRGGRLYGRGVCDMKGYVALSVWALVEAQRLGLQRPLQLALSYDEEVGCTGAGPMLETLQSAFPKASLALIGEPSQMQPISAHKGGVFCAMVLDSLDGRVARMTNTQSAFGEQMDSLSDMVSFGAAPALISYVWALNGLGRWGWFAAFVYCACAALRLARFNVNTQVVDKRYFQGLPSPAAAALVAGFIWWMTDTGVRGPAVAWPMFCLALFAGLTMVTNVPFYSFKDVSMKRSVPFAVIVLIALGIALVNIDPPTVMFGIFVVYGLSGYVVYGWRKAKGVQTSVISTSTDEPDERGLHK